jgi:hypothetical protein
MGLTYFTYSDIILSEQGEKRMNAFPFRFKDEKQKREFKVRAFYLDKSMNELLGDLVTRYLDEIRKEVA